MIPIPRWISPLVNGLLLLLALALVVSFWLAFGEWILLGLFAFVLVAGTIAVIFKGEPECICPPGDVLEDCPKCGMG
jgi:uncharacterized membrane protein YccC